MKILLIQPAQERGLGFRSLAVVEPLGLESIAGSLPEHEIKILDLRLENHLPKAGSTVLSRSTFIRLARSPQLLRTGGGKSPSL